jgi:[acyl-carrier-protein] S-malonyltransferase
MATFRVLEARHPARVAGAVVAAGHSLGEYSAGVAAGAYAFADAVRTVHLRGKFIQESVPEGVGAMAAILGLAPDSVAKACDDAAVETGKIVSPANFNSPEQTVTPAVRGRPRLGHLKERGAKKAAAPFRPFHCALMQPAADRLRLLLDGLAVEDPRIPVVTNVDAALARLGDEVRIALARQVASAVRWVESVEAMAQMGVTEGLEIGPGAVLAGLVRRIRKEIPVTSIGKADQLAP